MNKIKYTQKLIEENIFERKKETIYKHDFTDEMLLKYDKIFDTYLTPELEKIIQLQNTYSINMKYVIKSQNIKSYLEKLYIVNCPSILKVNLLEQQFFLLYVISISFYRFNERKLNWVIDDFINRIYLTNIIYIFSKHFVQSKKLILKLIKNIYKEIKESSLNNIDPEIFYTNEIKIKNDIIHLFLTNIAPKFNSLEIENIEDFYTVIFKRIFFFYLKSKTLLSIDVELDSQLMNQEEPSNLLEPTSERYRIYEEAIYLAQIQEMCEHSTSFNELSLEFNKIKKILLPNEIQKLLFNQNSKSKSNLLAYKVNFYKVQSFNDSKLQEIKKKLPLIYKLLRSIHIISSTSSFTNINKEYMKNQFYLFLLDLFKNQFNIDVISPIINNISTKLVESLTTGEFIDMITLSQIDINGSKFIDQFKQFLKLVINFITGTEGVLENDNNATS